MKNHKKMLSVAAMLIGVVLLLVSCGGTSGDEGTSSSKTKYGTVPSRLEAIENLSSDAFNASLAGDFGKVSSSAYEINKGWKAFRNRAVKDGAYEDDVLDMDHAVKGLYQEAGHPTNRTLLARSANQISDAMDGLYAVYHPEVPPVILELVYLVRELELNGLDKDYTAAQADLSALRVVWSTLRNSALDQGGSDVVREFEHSMNLQQQYIDDRAQIQLVDESTVGVDLVDQLTNLFE